MKMAHCRESRMREIRQSGLARGEADTIGLSCPDQCLRLQERCLRLPWKLVRHIPAGGVATPNVR
jgi:hypothetical protein